jgi:uncharacterized membrane protein
VQIALLVLLAGLMISAGVMHFVTPRSSSASSPVAPCAGCAGGDQRRLRDPIRGGAAGSGTRRWAAWGLIALLIAVFPANVNMALNHLPFGRQPVPTWALWARLPLQAVLIAWAWSFTRPWSNGMPG